MSYKVRQTHYSDEIIEFFNDSKLFHLAMCDEDITLYEAGEYTPDFSGYSYFIIEKNGMPLSLVRLRMLSNTTAEMHGYLLSKYWGRDLSISLYAALESYLVKHTQIYKLVIPAPASCLQTIKTAARLGYEVEGALVLGTRWRGKFEDLMLLGKFLDRGIQ